MSWSKATFRDRATLMLLVFSSMLLAARLVYLFLADTKRFPINTVKVLASYQFTSRQQIETILSRHLNTSFFMVPIHRLHAELKSVPWIKHVTIERIWPDSIKITLTEKRPIATWKDSLLMEDSTLLKNHIKFLKEDLPRFSGPDNQVKDVLQIYQKLSKILSAYDLHVTSLLLSDNQALELRLTNGLELRLGKRDIELRLKRFCEAYPQLMAEHTEQLTQVDLRYARGMAVRWKKPTGR